MGFFKATCDTCQKEVGLNRFKTAEGWICPDCFNRCGYTGKTPITTKTNAEIQADLAEKEAQRNNPANTEQNAANVQDEFQATKTVEDYIEFDEARKKWRIPEPEPLFFGTKKEARIYNFDDIVEFELEEDGEVIARGDEHDAFESDYFGDADLIIGGKTGRSVINYFKIKITVNDLQNPVRYIKILDDDEADLESVEYEEAYDSARKILSTFALILKLKRHEAAASVQAQSAAPVSAADEILKFKTLLDSGVITLEEFEAKKKQLLGL
ncbi:MAG TPA: SHOCT domain-containing protein [Bacillota bacterium]|nr:SHOCT domain-containing protein [Bacillota bacterium]